VAERGVRRDKGAQGRNAHGHAGLTERVVGAGGRPLWRCGRELIATPLIAGLKRPVPIRARISPGRMIVHEECTPASVISTMPPATSARPTLIIARAETFSPSAALPPDTKNMIAVPGMYTRPVSIADRCSTFCRYSVV
jgi:hypothetical protein